MLTEVALKYLKVKDKPYKVTDRDGMYAHVSPGGTLSLRLDDRVSGRRETVNLGRYGRDGISLVRAREMCLDAKRPVREGRSPAICRNGPIVIQSEGLVVVGFDRVVRQAVPHTLVTPGDQKAALGGETVPFVRVVTKNQRVGAAGIAAALGCCDALAEVILVHLAV